MNPDPTGRKPAARRVIRRCAGCRVPTPTSELARLVVDRDGTLVVDGRRRLPGRGCNVHPRADCLDRALSPRALARAFRSAPVSGAAAVRALLLAAGPRPAARVDAAQNRGVQDSGVGVRLDTTRGAVPGFSGAEAGRRVMDLR